MDLVHLPHMKVCKRSNSEVRDEHASKRSLADASRP
jgi:hypothetical protein